MLKSFDVDGWEVCLRATRCHILNICNLCTKGILWQQCSWRRFTPGGSEVKTPPDI